MDNLLDEFQQRQKLVYDSDFQNTTVLNFIGWLKTNKETEKIISELSEETRGVELAKKADFKTPPPVENPRDSVLLGLYFINQLGSGTKLDLLATSYGHDKTTEKIIRVYI
ncbi:MAG TPA: hypothetical protein DEP19_07560, partial [Anaerolineae bacterium]|nr:hypothetical protein [Anaerolineae bacterium]